MIEYKFILTLPTKKRHCSGGDLLSQGSGPSIIGAEGLNFWVRDGIRCDPFAKPPEQWRLSSSLRFKKAGPTLLFNNWIYLVKTLDHFKSKIVGKSNDLLVPLGSIHYWTYTCGLSRSYSLTSLWNLISETASRLDAFSAYLNRR